MRCLLFYNTVSMTKEHGVTQERLLIKGALVWLDGGFRQAAGELQVSLRQVSPFQGGTQELLLEINEWLKETVSRRGTLWLKEVNVNCSLLSEEMTLNAEESVTGRI